jgi:hypothetical protein
VVTWASENSPGNCRPGRAKGSRSANPRRPKRLAHVAAIRRPAGQPYQPDGGFRVSNDKKAIPIIHAQAVYTISSLTEALSLRKGTLPREIRKRRLRYAKRAGRVWILGEWVLEWLKSGEVVRKKEETTN